jgi:hypothetical protein
MAYKTLTALMLLVLLTGCATTTRMMDMPLKKTPDEEAIMGTFAFYLICATVSQDVREEEIEEPEAEESSFLDSLFNTLFSGFGEAMEKAVCGEVRAQLSRQHEALCQLFDVDTDTELDVWFVADSLDIAYPATYAGATRRRGLIDIFDLSSSERRTYGACMMFNVRSDIADGVERPEAKLTFDIYFLPPGSLGDDPPSMVSYPEVLKQRRTLHLVKSVDWAIVHDVPG